MITRVIIIEHVEEASSRLQKLTAEVLPGAVVDAVLTGVFPAVAWLKEHTIPDLIFMNTDLPDGSGFEIFKQVHIISPVIFTTDSDKYALQAFKVNSVDYLCKPVEKEDLQRAVTKLRVLQSRPATLINYQQLIKAWQEPPFRYRERFMLKIGDSIRSLHIDEIAYFFTRKKMNFVCINSGRVFPIDYNLDRLERMLDPKQFFRINRQYIVCLSAIDEMRSHSRGRVVIRLNPPADSETIVSVERAADFRTWIGGD